MPKPATRSDSTVDATVGVAAVDIERMVQEACQKATELLKTELLKLFSDITTRLESVERRLVTLEKKSLDHEVALNDLSSRVLEVQSSIDCLEVSGTAGVASDRLQDCMKEIEAVRVEARAAVCSANEIEQYGRRNNIRIRGLSMGTGEDCRSAVVSFLHDKLHVDICADDIEAAHVLPKTEHKEVVESARAPNHHSPSGAKQQGPPMIIVRFFKREVRDNIIRKRRALKNTQYTILEDMTNLNLKTLTRVTKDPAVASAWFWNGKINVMKKTGVRMIVKPYQLIS